MSLSSVLSEVWEIVPIVVLLLVGGLIALRSGTDRPSCRTDFPANRPQHLTDGPPRSRLRRRPARTAILRRPTSHARLVNRRAFRRESSSRVLTPQGLRERTRSAEIASHGPNPKPRRRPKAPGFGPESPRRGPATWPTPQLRIGRSPQVHMQKTASVDPSASYPLAQNDTKVIQFK